MVTAAMEQTNLFTADALRGPWGPEEVARLSEAALGCTRCKLHETRANVVFGAGCSSRPVLAIVGEGPGLEDDTTGKPFGGRSGKLLDKMLEAMQLDRDKIYICNVVGCRPPKNRKPEDDEMAACREFLVGQLRAVRPLTILTMGNTASQALLETTKGVTRLREAGWHEWEGTPLRTTFHPAFLLRNPDAKRAAWADLKAVMAKVGL
jgi:DNA polymerase